MRSRCFRTRGSLTCTSWEGALDAERRSNTEVFANAVLRVVAGLKVGVELSGWWTEWVNRETSKAFRAEVAFIYGF